MVVDQDEDEIMLSATHQSQFTQSLLLFVSATTTLHKLRLTLIVHSHKPNQVDVIHLISLDSTPLSRPRY